MDEKVYTYMEKVRGYFREKEGYGGIMNSDEVLKRLMDYAGDKSYSKKDESPAEKIKLNLDELMNHRQNVNRYWHVSNNAAITSHRRFIGRFIVKAKRFVIKLIKSYVDPMTEQQNTFNAAVTNMLNELSNKLVLIEDDLNSILSDIRKSSNITGERINEAKMELEIELEHTREQLNSLKGLYQSNFSYLAFKQRQAAGLTATPVSADNKYSKAAAEEGHAGKMDYFMFENNFRGSEEKIRETLKPYLKYFTQDNVLDIGCGRGEFLELMAEKEIKASGIDIYDDFVAYCKEKGLSAEKADAVRYLESAEDNSLGGIFLGQVLEHLDQDYLVQMIELAYRKLKPGCYFVAETPNPTMVSTFTNAFYMDPSHVKPVHPETMKFLMSYFGYRDIDVIFNERSKIPYELPMLEADGSVRNLQEFNNGIDLLNRFIFGYQDYAIVGRK